MNHWLLLCLVALGVTSAQGVATEVRSDGQIAGVVTDRQTAAPIKSAEVYLGRIGRGPAAEPGRQFTDSRGGFRFVDLPKADDYFVSVSKPGYADSRWGDLIEDAPLSRIRLKETPIFSNANVALSKQASISGDVTEERGEPVIGAYVRILRLRFVAGAERLTVGPTTRTDDRGSYNFSGVPPGRYLVEVLSVQETAWTGQSSVAIGGLAAKDLPGLDLNPEHRLLIGRFGLPALGDMAHTARAYPPTFFPDASSVAKASHVEVGPGDRQVTASINIQPVVAGEVRGRLELAIAGRPIGRLRLVSTELDGLGDQNESAVSLVEPDGSFCFLAVPPGDYWLESDRPVDHYSAGMSTAGFTSQFAPLPMPVGKPGPVQSFVRQLVSVSPSATTEVAAITQPTRRMRGKVFLPSGTHGFVAPTLIIESQTGKLSEGRVLSVIRPEDGGFMAEGLVPGTYVVRLMGVAGAIASVRVAGQDVGPSIDLTNRDAEDVTIEVVPGAALTGRVLSAGKPVAPAVVLVFPRDESLRRGYGSSSPRIQVTSVDSTGRFVVHGLPQGLYFAIALGSAASHWQDVAFLSRISPLSTQIEIDSRGSATVDLSFISDDRLR